MERIKAKIVKNYDQLKEEHDAVLLILNNILEKNREIVRDNANERQASMNKKHFLNVLEFQHSCIQKLLEIEMELDEFLTQYNVAYTGNFNNCPIKSEISSISSCLCLTDTNTPVIFHAQEDLQICETPTISELVEESSSIQSTKIEKLDMLSCEDYSQTNSVDTSEKSNLPLNEKDEKPNPVIIETKQILNGNASESGSIPKKANYCEKLTDETSSSGSVSRSNKDDSKKASADVSSSEETSQREKFKTKNIQEKLKSKKLMTRRDRYLQNLQRPDIPDLSFKPSNKAFDSAEYITCPESSSSTSVNKGKEKTRKKRRNITETLRDTLGSIGIGYKQPPEPYVNSVCLVSYIVSPSEFYINRYDENIEVIDTIGFQLAEIFKDTSSRYLDKKTAMEKLGNYCVCYLEEYDCWYRVTVTNWRLKARDYQEDLVTVYLVDYGHTSSTSYKTLRELSEEFCHVPPCAIRCHLAWLYPTGSTKDNLLETWPKNGLDYFKNLVSSNGVTLYKVLYVEKVGNSWGVDIIKNGDKDDTNTFGQQLIDNDMAVEIFQDANMIVKDEFFLNQLKTAQGMAGISPSMNSEERLEKYHENTANGEYDNIDQAMLRYKARDEARICKNARPDGTCFKGRRCKWEHEKLRPDGITTDKQYIYVSAFKQLDMPAAGTIETLRITNVVSVNTFYASMIRYATDLINLTSKMNKKETILKYKNLEVNPARGEMVIAKNWNGYWYRGQVKDDYHFPQNPEETFQVFFVDLGEVADVKMSDLRTITPEFLYLPCQAIYCRLHNVKPKEDLDPEVGKNYSESHFLCQIFNAHIEYASYSALEVLLKKEGTSEDIGEQIIEEGYGELRTEHVYPAETMLVD